MQLFEGLPHKPSKYFLDDDPETCFACSVPVSRRKIDVNIHVLPFYRRVSGMFCHTFPSVILLRLTNVLPMVLLIKQYYFQGMWHQPSGPEASQATHLLDAPSSL